MDGLSREAALMRDHPDYSAPEAFVEGIREMLDSDSSHFTGDGFLRNISEYNAKFICIKPAQCAIYSGDIAVLVEPGPSVKNVGLAENCVQNPSSPSMAIFGTTA
jgi:hypothetical protein